MNQNLSDRSYILSITRKLHMKIQANPNAIK